MQIKNKSLVIILAATLTGCSMFSSLPTYENHQESSINANFSKVDKQYFVCVSESCNEATPLQPITEEDLKPLQPDVVPLVTVRRQAPIIKYSPSKKHKKKKIKRRSKPKSRNSDLIKKCYFIKKGDSDNGNLNGKEMIENIEKQINKKGESNINLAKNQNTIGNEVLPTTSNTVVNKASNPVVTNVQGGGTPTNKANVTNQVVNTFK